MATAFDPTTRQPVEVSDEEFLDAVAEGRVGVPKSARIGVRAPDGTIGVIPATSIPEAREMGYSFVPDTEVRRLELHEQAGGQNIRAGVEGVARGLTLGLSDVAQRALGVPAEEIAARREANPIISGTTEIAGAIGPVLATGGAAAPAVGVRGAIRGALAATPAGGVARLGEAVSGAAKAAVARAGVGAATRAAAGRFAPAPFAGAAARKAIPMAAGGAVEGALFGAGQAVTEEALGDANLNGEKLLAGAGLGTVLGSSIGGLAGVFGTVGSRTAKRLAAPKAAPKGVAESLRGQAESEAVRAAGAMLKDFRGLNYRGIINERGRVLLDEQVVTAGAKLEDIAERAAAKRDVYGARVGEIEAELDRLAAAKGPRSLPNTYDIAGRMQREVVAPLRGSPLHEETGTVQFLDNLIERVRGPGDVPMTFAEARTLKQHFDEFLRYDKELTPRNEYAKRLRGILNDEMEKKAQALKPDLFSEYKLAKQRFGHLKETAEMAVDKGLRGEAAASSFGLYDRLASIAGVGMFGLEGILAGLASKVVRERGSQFLAVSLDRVAKFLDNQTLRVQGAARAVAKAQAQAPRVTTRGTLEVLDSVRFGERAYASAPANEREAFERRAAELRDLIGDPQRLDGVLGSQMAPVESVAPTMAAAMRAGGMRGAEFLASKLPQPAKPANPVFGRTRRVSDAEIQKWTAYLEAVADPMGVLDRLAEGYVTPEAAEVFRNVFPGLHAEARQQIEEAVEIEGAEIPYNVTLALSRFFGQPLHATQERGFVGFMQGVHAQSKQKATERPPPRAVTGKGLGLAENMQTTASRVSGL